MTFRRAPTRRSINTQPFRQLSVEQRQAMDTAGDDYDGEDLDVVMKAHKTADGTYTTNMEDATTDADAFSDSSVDSCLTCSSDRSFDTCDSRSPACSSGEDGLFNATMTSSDQSLEELYDAM